MLNRIVLIGRLTRDPELRYTPASGVAVATFTLAVNRIYSKQKEADFIPIVVWRNQAEFVPMKTVKAGAVPWRKWLPTASISWTAGKGAVSKRNRLHLTPLMKPLTKP
jgi:hypothetical protein